VTSPILPQPAGPRRAQATRTACDQQVALTHITNAGQGSQNIRVIRPIRAIRDPDLLLTNVDKYERIATYQRRVPPLSCCTLVARLISVPLHVPDSLHYIIAPRAQTPNVYSAYPGFPQLHRVDEAASPIPQEKLAL